MVWADDDARELQARRAAAELRDDPARHSLETIRARAAVNVPVRAQAPGRDFALEPVGAGWVIYSTATYDSALDPAGVVVEVIHDQVTDLETGEICPRTRYRCLRYWTPSAPWVFVDAADVDLTQLRGIDRVEASAAARWLVKPLVVSPHAHHRRQQLNADETSRLRDAGRLAAALAF